MTSAFESISSLTDDDDEYSLTPLTTKWLLVSRIEHSFCFQLITNGEEKKMT